jgi:hypothetical protein
MADLAELHQDLGGLLGFTLATALLVRRAAALADRENERELVQSLQQLDNAAAQVQRRCEMLVGRHAGLRAGRITATSRKIKASVMGCCREDATIRDLLKLLKELVNQVRVSTVALTAHSASNSDKAIAEFVDFLVLAQEDCATAVTEACTRLERAA